MAYADQQMSGNKIIAIIIVALIHVAVGYALITGLAYSALKKAVERVTTVDIEEEVPEEEEPPPDLEAEEDHRPPDLEVEEDGQPPDLEAEEEGQPPDLEAEKEGRPWQRAREKPSPGRPWQRRPQPSPGRRSTVAWPEARRGGAEPYPCEASLTLEPRHG